MAGVEGWAGTLTAVTDFLKKPVMVVVATCVSGLVLWLTDSAKAWLGFTGNYRWVAGLVFLIAAVKLGIDVGLWLWVRIKRWCLRVALNAQRQRSLEKLTAKEKAHLIPYLLEESSEQTRPVGGVMGVLSQKGIVVRTNGWSVNSMTEFALPPWARKLLLANQSLYLQGYCQESLAEMRGSTWAEMQDFDGTERSVLEAMGIQSQRMLERDSLEQHLTGTKMGWLLSKIRSFVSSEKYAN